jgi:hypothetical protein
MVSLSEPQTSGLSASEAVSALLQWLCRRHELDLRPCWCIFAFVCSVCCAIGAAVVSCSSSRQHSYAH